MLLLEIIASIITRFHPDVLLYTPDHPPHPGDVRLFLPFTQETGGVPQSAESFD